MKRHLVPLLATALGSASALTLAVGPAGAADARPFVLTATPTCTPSGR